MSTLRDAVRPLTGLPEDYDLLLDRIGDARFVLLGEATHGTEEFYMARARITQRLIREKGFHAMAVEADWPDAWCANRYVQGRGRDRSANDALGSFRRFPVWMWRNTEVARFLQWLRDYNAMQPPPLTQVGFYGLDLYSLMTSMQAVVGYLEKTDPQAARRARYRYSCFDHFGDDTQAYGYAAGFGLTRSCEDDVVEQLLDMQRHFAAWLSRDGQQAEDELFYAEQNALLVKNAEQYYRSMFGSRISSWNLRDHHMAETLDRLAVHIGRRAGSARIVVWAHNSHLGDARATEMRDHGELNLGQLTRQFHPGETFLVGFTTYSGEVTAASEWGGPAERKTVRPALAGSYESLFHVLDVPRFLMAPIDMPELNEPRLERAIGVIYLPESERASHYFHARLPQQFDAVLHFDRTTALEPLEVVSQPVSEVPETYPSGV